MSEDPVNPTIGITIPSRAADLRDQRRAERLTALYRGALQAHAAIVVELAPQRSEVALDSLHGLLLTGGGDVHPRHYGQRPHPRLGPVDPPRDDFELSLTRAALARRLPVMGICRGVQVLGIALGGQLIQDIGSQIENAERHSAGKSPPAARHWVDILPDSRLSQIVGARRLRVNSSHHQANGRLGPRVRAVARSRDSVIEAIEPDASCFAIGVQWHPERMWRRAPRQRRLFAAFVAAARCCARDRPEFPQGVRSHESPRPLLHL